MFLKLQHEEGVKYDKLCKEANDFLETCNAAMKIEFIGLAVNKNRKENDKRNLY